MSRKRHWALLGSAAFLLSAACQFEPTAPDLVFTLNEQAIAENTDLAVSEASQARLAGALEFLFGTPQAPSYLVQPEWLEDGFDPTYWGQDALGDAELDELVRRNEEAYAAQLAAIESEDFDAVTEPRYAPDLWATWQALLDEMPEEGPDGVLFEDDDGEPVTWKDEALYQWANYYPTLSASADMYRTQCFHCHGASGGGDGSTADFLNPRPRDYRQGTFKFTALNNKAKPRHRDLMRILKEGIYTTAMPSFRRFTDAQLSGLADYVRLLSIRGETEILMASDFDPDEGLHFENLQENYAFVVERWLAGEQELIVYEDDVPHATPERIARGRELYLSDQAANCVKCHGTLGRGDGESVRNNPDDATDDWGEPILPRDLTSGIYRFGRRPIDVYRRIYAGINGTPMPAHYDMQIVDPTTGETRNMDEDDIWDLVFYVRSLGEREPHVAAAAQPDDEEAH